MRPCLRHRRAVPLTLAVSAPAARADVEPLPPPATVVPPDGALRPASSWPAATPFELPDFTIYASAPFVLAGPFAIEVATSSKPDPDGTLPDAAVVDRLVATPRAGFTGIFSARPDVGAQWAGTPGTYWWQAYFRRTDPAGGCDPCVYATPLQPPCSVRRGRRPHRAEPLALAGAGSAGRSGRTVLPPSRGTLTRAARARRAPCAPPVRRRTGVRARRLRSRCTLATRRTTRPAARRGATAGFRYRGTMFV